MILDRSVLGDEAKALLRAILKLRPSAGIVVLAEDEDEQFQDIVADVVFLPTGTPADNIIQAMVEAKSLASRRSS